MYRKILHNDHLSINRAKKNASKTTCLSKLWRGASPQWPGKPMSWSTGEQHDSLRVLGKTGPTARGTFTYNQRFPGWVFTAVESLAPKIG